MLFLKIKQGGPHTPLLSSPPLLFDVQFLGRYLHYAYTVEAGHVALNLYMFN